VKTTLCRTPRCTVIATAEGKASRLFKVMMKKKEMLLRKQQVKQAQLLEILQLILLTQGQRRTSNPMKPLRNKVS